MLRRVLVTDNVQADGRACDVVLWLGAGSAPETLGDARVVVQASSWRAAAVFLAAHPAEVRLELRDPLAFAQEMTQVRSLPVLRAA